MNRHSKRLAELGYHTLHPSERIVGHAEPLIRQFETLIGANLPEDYREFLLEYGGAFLEDLYEAPIIEAGHLEEYACPRGFFGFYKPDARGVPHSLDLPANYSRYKSRVRNGLIPVAHAIGGNLICLAVAGSNRGSVYYWDHETCSLWLVANSFGAFLEALAQSKSEDDDNGDE